MVRPREQRVPQLHRWLVLAREFRGLMQRDIVRMAEVSKNAYSQYELGLSTPAEDTLARIAAALEFPLGFFTDPDPVFGIGVYDMYHYRKRASASARLKARIVAEVTIRERHLRRLTRPVELAEVRVPRLSPMDYEDDIERIAREVRRAWALPAGPIDNLSDTFELAGGIIVHCRFGTDLVDAISVWSSERPIVFLNIDVPGDRLRWSLGHEIGHLVMHDLPNPEMEEQANTFAGEILMPREEAVRALNRVSLPVLASLKPYWKISMAALLVRATRMGSITPGQQLHLWRQMAPYRRVEPPEIDVSVEEAHTLNELIAFHLEELGFSRAELATALASSSKDFEALYGSDESGLSLVRG